MFVTCAMALALAVVSVSAAPEDYTAAHNVTPIIGTWSSGSQRVIPGEGFANPAKQSFIYPTTAGVGYSFSADGWYELARYRFASNASDPNCISGTVLWAHGHYTLVSNGSIVLTPVGDGYQQVQAQCRGTSTWIQNYNFTELMTHWNIISDVLTGLPKLLLYQYDGAPVAPLFRVSTDPIMLPKKVLRNLTATVVTHTTDGLISTETQWSKRSFFMKRGGATPGVEQSMAAVGGLVVLAMLSTLL
ncbi:chaperone for protein-folding within the ER, fungal-domain-containing protein [Mycena rebaudengoi]|nr:chaperone for protein-folding within the ER, fungal-domain-containing protein [Mycena rebaudengoi]